MTPRPDIVAIREDATLGELRALFREQEYSRFPVYKESLDNIAGFVFVKDLVVLGAADEPRPIRRCCARRSSCPRPSACPSCSNSSSASRRSARSSSTNTAAPRAWSRSRICSRRSSARSATNTTSSPSRSSTKATAGFVFSGKVNIDEVAQRLDVQIEREGFETVGGYLMSHLGRVPAVGERFEIDGLTVEVLDAERRRVNRVRIGKAVHAKTARATDEETARDAR